MITPQTCSRCRNWSGPYRPAEANGDCRAHAPVVLPIGADGQTRWPSTAHDDWCAEFKPKPIRQQEPTA